MSEKAPPRGCLAFRVGIVGHRPNRLPQEVAGLAQLRTSLRTILEDIAATVQSIAAGPDAGLYAPGLPQLRAVSPLAEGSDRIFAEEALTLNYALCCPMPFLQEELEKDFIAPAALESNSLAHFRTLLERARSGPGLTVFEMDGQRDQAPDAYGAAGRVVLNQTDLLVTVWDGGEAAGPGGTVHTLHEALRFHVPVIWIDARAPERWRLIHIAADLSGEDASGWSNVHNDRDALRQVVKRIVSAEFALPETDADDDIAGATRYFAEREPGLNLAFCWKSFRDFMVNGKIALPRIFVTDFQEQVKKEWPIAADGGGAVSPISDWVNARLRDHYAWADGLADFYADAHRSAFIVSYFLTAFAVFGALLPIATASDFAFEKLCIYGELGVLFSILLLLIWGRNRHWHERWTQYRLLAELIRELRFMIPLGGGRPLPRIPAHLAVYGDPARTWMYWHIRAIARETGIPSARVTPDYIRDCLDFLEQVVGDRTSGQWGFHLISQRRARALSQRMRVIAICLFGLTIAGVTFRLVMHSFSWGVNFLSSEADNWLILTSAVLPALGAAFEGIGNQGEFTRVAKRSAAMASGFEKYSGMIAGLRKAPCRLRTVIPLSSEIAGTMVEEVVDWRAVFIDRSQ